MAARKPLISADQIEVSIVVVRGQKAMLDADLAALYGVSTKRLNEQVRRNRARFPADFMFQLSAEEASALRSQIATLKNEPNLKSQIATSKSAHGAHRKYRPNAFTEQGVAMLSSVLHSKRAVLVNIEIMRAFVRLRHALAANADLARRVDGHEARLDEHDRQFVEVVKYIHKLSEPPQTPRRRIGFQVTPEGESANEDTPSPPSTGKRGRMRKPRLF